MKILIASQYFPPEITAGAVRVHAFAAGLARRGHEVEVICEVPNHPVGMIAPGYGGRPFRRAEMDGFRVRYVWVHATPSKALRSRLVNYGSFAAMATIAGASTRRADVILASSPPLPVGSVGATLAIRHRAPWVLDIRDLWPDAAVALGQLGEGRILNLTRRLERRLYESAAAITATTEPFRVEIEQRGGAGKTELIPNGTTEEFLAAGAAPPEQAELGDSNERFRWVYAGNLGLASGLDAAIEAAAKLGDQYQLVLVGDGPRREELRRLASALPADRVVFRGPVPPAEAARLMRASDALLVSRAPAPGLDRMVLSKLYDCCAVARPIVVSAPGETRRLAEEAGAALCIPPGDPGELAAAIRRLRDDAAFARGLAERARAFAEASSRERGVEQLESLLLRLER